MHVKFHLIQLKPLRMAWVGFDFCGNGLGYGLPKMLDSIIYV